MIPADGVSELEALLVTQGSAELASLASQLLRIQTLAEAAILLENEAVLAALGERRNCLEERMDRVERALSLLRGESDAATCTPIRPPLEAESPTVPSSSTAAEAGLPAAPSVEPQELTEDVASKTAESVADEVESPPASPAAVTPATRSIPARDSWEPRPLEALQEELVWLQNFVGGPQGGGLKELALFKHAGTRLWGASEERTRYPGDQSEWKTVKNRIRDLQKEHWDNVYLVFLSPKVRLTPQQWQEWSALYQDLALAEDALEWVEEAGARLGKPWLSRDAKTLFEAIGAVCTRLWRYINCHVPDQHDEQQSDMHYRLLEFARTNGFFLDNLQDSKHVSDDSIERDAIALEQKWESLRTASDKTRRRKVALESLGALFDSAGFGAQEGDADRLCDLLAECLEAGVPATQKYIRDHLVQQNLDWMLEDDSRVTRVLQAVREERHRRDTATSAIEDEDHAHDDTLLTQLLEIVPHTSGKRGVIIGGQAREDSRRQIQESFEFAELRWPSTDPNDKFEKSLQEIKRADVVFLTRFNRRASSEAHRACRLQGKPLIVLPKGYGLREVTRCALESLSRRHGEALVAA